MLRSSRVGVLLVLFLVLQGCAGSKSGGGTSGSFDYSAEIGVATDYDTQDKTRRLLTRFNYELIREEQTLDGFYFETRWKERRPFQDEQEMGVTAARTRIIIRARPRSRTGGGIAKMNRVRFLAENEVLVVGTGEWTRAPMSKMLKGYLKELVNDFKTEFRAGMRRF